MAARGIFIEKLTWADVEAALTEFDTLLNPLGARCKEHGHHLPLNTDWISAEYLAHRVVEQCRVTPERYDALLSENVVAIELFDASANNIVIECIARNTPILVNRHPAVVEYLGQGYPLYFSDPAQVPDMLAADRVFEAHEYLVNLDKTWLSGADFRDSIAGILRSLVQE